MEWIKNMKNCLLIRHPSDVILSYSKKNEINKRFKKKPNINLKIIKKFKKLQLPVEYKKKQSNFVIKNNFRNNSIFERYGLYFY